MVDLDVLLEKVNSIQNCLKRIHDTVEKDTSDFADLDTLDIVVLNLQRAVQLTIDLAFHIASQEELGLPQSLKDSFRLLKTHHIISASIAKKMEKIVGFRNVAVHDYQAIDPDILRNIVKNHLVDLEEFYTAILNRYSPK